LKLFIKFLFRKYEKVEVADNKGSKRFMMHISASPFRTTNALRQICLSLRSCSREKFCQVLFYYHIQLPLFPSLEKCVIKSGTGIIAPQSVVSKTQSAVFEAGQTTHTLTITGTFETRYSNVHRTSIFSGIKSITSRVASGVGSWKQTGYEYELIDGGRTYVIYVSGTYTISGQSYPVTVSIEFYCNADGSVS
jgi:hypothetical protein